ncbi:MAG: hypothetical protein NTY19_48770 [Planctomycetota bacterium]|nr:hypothetical protein [Planctomycetota bacterium]
MSSGEPKSHDFGFGAFHSGRILLVNDQRRYRPDAAWFSRVDILLDR